MTKVPDWFLAPIQTSNPFRRDFYICTNCGGQSCGGIYASICPKCHGIQSDPPRHARSQYLCNTCARSSKRFVCECDYSVVQQPPTPRPLVDRSNFTPKPDSPDPFLSADPCCCRCNWCNFLCRCVCCCLDCGWKSSSCTYCCTSKWNCCGGTCYWSWCGCSCSQPPT